MLSNKAHVLVLYVQVFCVTKAPPPDGLEPAGHAGGVHDVAGHDGGLLGILQHTPSLPLPFVQSPPELALEHI